MASATISSSSCSPFETNSNNVRDDSFSSYLTLIRQSFSTELANPSSRRPSFQTIAGSANRTLMDDDDNNEIDIFAAEKYFRGSLDVQNYREMLTSSNSCSSSKNKERSTMTKSRSSTCSETSTTSHSILLGRSSLQRQQQQQPQPAAARRRISFLDVFRCCFKKNVVRDDAADCSKLPPTAAVLQSESSSDLFEIESASIGSQYRVYEPSEASIEWSVATASMANLSAVTSSASAAEVKVRRRSTSGVLPFGCARGKAVSATADKVGALERYRVMMDLAGSASVAGTVAAALPGRRSLGCSMCMFQCHDSMLN